MKDYLRSQLQAALNTIDNTATNEKLKLTAYYNRLMEKERVKEEDEEV